MNENLCSQNQETDSCSGRRQFLVKAGVTAGGLVLSLSSASAQDKPAETPPEELVLKLAADSPLAKIGGSQTLETKAGKVIVIHTAENAFVAYAAKCTHSGGPLSYDPAAKQLTCPWHGSKFGTDGNPVAGPAKRPLKSHTTQSAVVIGLKQ